MTTTPPATLGIAARRACLASMRAKSGSIRSKCQTSDHRKRSPVRHCAVRALCAFGRSRSHRPRRRTAACAGGGSSFFWWCSTRLPSSRHKISLRRDTSIWKFATWENRVQVWGQIYSSLHGANLWFAKFQPLLQGPSRFATLRDLCVIAKNVETRIAEYAISIM